MNWTVSVVLVATSLVLSVYCLEFNGDDEGVLSNVTHRIRQLRAFDDMNILPQPLDIWSSVLIDWTLNRPVATGDHREARAYRTTSRYIPGKELFINRRIGEAAIEPSFRPMPNYPRQRFPVPQADANRLVRTEVSETDLYLLGAIEKLAYRVDYLEHRLKKTDQLLLQLVAETQKEKPSKDTTSAVTSGGTTTSKPSLIVPVAPPLCPRDFVHIADTCYHIGAISPANWKTANNICKSVGAQLAEFETIAEFKAVMSYLGDHAQFHKHSYWLGGLNPGLLWIWSSSARPINPYVSLQAIEVASASNTTQKIKEGVVAAAASMTAPKDKPATDSNLVEIKGSGRCLNVLYSGTSQSYEYFGQDCNVRHEYLCELQNHDVENEIARARSLFG